MFSRNLNTSLLTDISLGIFWNFQDSYILVSFTRKIREGESVKVNIQIY